MPIIKNDAGCCVYEANRESAIVVKDNCCPTPCTGVTEIREETTFAGPGSTHKPEFFLPVDAPEVACGRRLGYFGSGNTTAVADGDHITDVTVGTDGTITVTEADGDTRVVPNSSDIMVDGEYTDMDGNPLQHV